jgi:hypothetical protein
MVSSSGLVTTSVATRAITRREATMVVVGRVGLDLDQVQDPTAGFRRGGRIAGGRRIPPLAGPTLEPQIR